MRDCNTCKHHQQGRHPAYIPRCNECLGPNWWMDPRTPTSLPNWEPMNKDENDCQSCVGDFCTAGKDCVTTGDPLTPAQVAEMICPSDPGPARSEVVDTSGFTVKDLFAGLRDRADMMKCEPPAGVDKINLTLPLLPTEAKARKGIPIASGVLDYFPAALAEVAKLSKAGNDQHNPGQPLHWSRGKSNDHADTMLRHFLERGTIDTDGMRHSAKMVWRALALLQCELEAAGAPLARGAKVD